jgi:hypothetical protein
MKRRTQRPPTSRFSVKSWLAAIAGVACGATLIRRDWIELLFRVEPDHHRGYIEWLISGALLAACLIFARLAQHEQRQLAPADTQAAP